MPKQIRILLKVIGIALGIILVLWLGLAAYITINKQSLLKAVSSELNNSITGKLSIENMEPALIRGFPGISVLLKNVLLRDSLFEKHGHNLIKANEVFVALNIFSLVGGNTEIQKLTIRDGEVYLFTDSLGKSNNSVLVRGSKSDKKGKRKQINRIEFRNVNFIQDNQQKKKLFNFDIHSLSAKFDYNSKGWKGDIQANIKVNSLAFNRARGSFIQNQNVKADLEMTYAEASGILHIPLQNIKIGEEKFDIGGNFRSTEKASDFKLTIVAPDIKFKNIIPFLTKNISTKLAIYDLKKPFFAKAVIQGSLKKRGDPKILVTWNVKNNDLTISGETINNCSFTGYFNNEVKSGSGYNDINSAIGFANLKGSYYTIPFTSDTLRVVNLKKPVIEGRFQSNFALDKLNNISGSESFHFHKGTARLNILYRAPYNKSKSIEPYINGTLKLNNATLNYHPRDLTFSGISGIFLFKGQDLFLQNLQAKSGSSSFVMDGSLKNFLNLYYTDPKKIILDWHVKSPQINLSEFLVFLARRKTVQRKVSNNRSTTRLFNQLDRVLTEANIHVELEAGKLIYRRFEANRVHSSILMKKTGIDLQDVSFNHADGRLQINGLIDQSGSINRFNIDTRIINVNITKLFYAFENFGQDAIAYQNLRGVFNSRTMVSGVIRDNGQMVPKSINGSVIFDIKNGALLNFEPMQKVGNFAFPNRDFSNILFSSLKTTLDINGSKITIHPMYIQSSVLNLYIEGIYGIPTGTDIALRIPLRNPKRDIGLSDSLKRERFDNGIVINLRGQDDENGNVKFKLGKKEEEGEIDEKEAKEREKLDKERERTLRREERKERRL
ncbi:AsmA-like C-terminal region-containing protein [Pedobacter sp. P351]|uniref:AsmA-like C-terminal region-containing protein n=1 Tax=Pedobacter superstes TaxID=3133441 RepID=UPI00309CE94E